MSEKNTYHHMKHKKNARGQMVTEFPPTRRDQDQTSTMEMAMDMSFLWAAWNDADFFFWVDPTKSKKSCNLPSCKPYIDVENPGFVEQKSWGNHGFSTSM